MAFAKVTKEVIQEMAEGVTELYMELAKTNIQDKSMVLHMHNFRYEQLLMAIQDSEYTQEDFKEELVELNNARAEFYLTEGE